MPYQAIVYLRRASQKNATDLGEDRCRSDKQRHGLTHPENCFYAVPIRDCRDARGRCIVWRQIKYMYVTGATRSEDRAACNTDPKDLWITILRREAACTRRGEGSWHKD